MLEQGRQKVPIPYGRTPRITDQLLTVCRRSGLIVTITANTKGIRLTWASYRRLNEITADNSAQAIREFNRRDIQP
jgi:hypothetical protein